MTTQSDSENNGLRRDTWQASSFFHKTILVSIQTSINQWPQYTTITNMSCCQFLIDIHLVLPLKYIYIQTSQYVPWVPVSTIIIIYLKNFPILYHWSDRVKHLCIWTMTFHLSHSDPDAAFQPMVKTCGLYVYIIQLFVWVSSPRSRAVAICPTGMKRKTLIYIKTQV